MGRQQPNGETLQYLRSENVHFVRRDEERKYILEGTLRSSSLFFQPREMANLIASKTCKAILGQLNVHHEANPPPSLADDATKHIKQSERRKRKGQQDKHPPPPRIGRHDKPKGTGEVEFRTVDTLPIQLSTRNARRLMVS